MPFFRRSKRHEEAASIPHYEDDQGRLKVQCWYCEQGVAYEGYDPCAVVVVLNWGEGDEIEKQVFAHLECFNKSAGKDVLMFD